CSKYLNAILDLDPVNHVARVQPGVVLDQLNRALDPHGLQFGPDVATASRANLGGMIGNNSAGARSIVYGKTSDHVRRLKVILSDGTTTHLGPLGPGEWDRKAEAGNLEGSIYRTVRDVTLANAREIRRRFPSIIRRVSGYNLRDILGPASPEAVSGGVVSGEGPQGDSPLTTHYSSRLHPAAGLHTVVIGSEGTLAVT